MMFERSIANTLEHLMYVTRVVGKDEWECLGESAVKDATQWLGCVDRATEATRARDITAAIVELEIAYAIELDWPGFDMADKLIKVLIIIKNGPKWKRYLEGQLIQYGNGI